VDLPIFLGTPPVVLIYVGTLDANGAAQVALPLAPGLLTTVQAAVGNPGYLDGWVLTAAAVVQT
jgi:hypothetical protein